jgi:hypothetical protein
MFRFMINPDCRFRIAIALPPIIKLYHGLPHNGGYLIQEPNNPTINVSRVFGALWKNLAIYIPIKLLVHFVVILLVFGQVCV